MTNRASPLNRWMGAIAVGLLALCCMKAPASAQKKPRQRVAVLTFKAIGTTKEKGEAVAEILRTELVNLGKFELVERGQFEKVVGELKRQRRDLFDEKTAVEIGRQSGAELVVIGSIIKLGNDWTLTSRFIDVKTGIAQIGKTISGNREDELSNMCRRLARSFAGKAYAETTPKKAIPKPVKKAIPKPVKKAIAKPVKKANARIEKVWTEHNVRQEGEKGFWIHTTFRIDNHRDRRGRLAVFFRFKGHSGWLKDYDKARKPTYSTPSGLATTQTTFTPKYTNTRFSDLKTFIPYSQLHLAKGRHDLEAVVEIHDWKKNRIAQSTARFVVNETINQVGQRAPGSARPVKRASLPPLKKPKAEIEKVWLDHNRMNNGLKGMWIHATFLIHNHKSRRGRVAVFFRPRYRRVWLKDLDRDRNPKYGAPGNIVTTQGVFTPKYKDTRFTDFTLFMPYRQLHMARGKHNLEAVVQIQDDKGNSLIQRAVAFVYTK